MLKGFNNSKNEVATKKKFERQLIRDSNLREYCVENFINLIEIDGRFIKGNMIKTFLEGELKVGEN